ncbi:RHS repeat-associated core domain-containing protein [Bacteroidales bacterium OttesenSCG-928-I21]|nr:RHS repeat-associated core domain-containing protein [Bacteroidales bacterium OttesenSCG-928-I21]
MKTAETTLYFYHSDHLGSTSFVSNAAGTPIQYLTYTPFGGVIQNKKATGSTYDTEFKFSGKALDSETQYSYFGARYYNSDLGIWLSVDPLAHKYPSLTPYNYCANNPVMLVDPDGEQVFPVHGTWSRMKTWKDMKGIYAGTKKAFNDDKKASTDFNWGGGNYSQCRTTAARELVAYILEERELAGVDASEPITLVGHSHGGNVAIEAINMMVEMPELEGIEINLLTLNTPVRDDYQLSEKAAERTNHVNVYNEKDIVQKNGGNKTIIGKNPSNKKFRGEFGKAGQTYENAKNINDTRRGGIYKRHQSNNYNKNWVDKISDTE